MDLANRTAIVTGGAVGIGRAIVLELVKRGANVVVNYHSSAAAAETLISDVAVLGGHAFALQADVSVFAEAKKLVDFAIETFGGLDILVNNAGVVADNLLLRMTEEQFDKVVDTDLKGVWNMCRHSLKPILRSTQGRIVNVSSVSGILGNPGQTNYSAAKAGVIGLSKALAREVASRGVTVNVVAPGFIDTAMTASMTPEAVAKWQDQIPLKRIGAPEDIAKAVAFLVSADASYITGHTLAVDGGIVM
ncbi:MAG TPA: 3-oxoacyl-[acyl-carrier-protein] reductase [Acholeplasmatales bacterium]|nr:MAG: 3-oxoacyl-[acyl-carrier-protein] reductase [Tenericutes bacterium GWF2_57_13]HAQ56208.1 3-oxoacyl-[acyl-carrier-protein] reductase [Acholeplasmatales bacterium]